MRDKMGNVIPEPTLGELIKRKRAVEGYDAKFERAIAAPCYCPHCGHRCTIMQILIPIGEDAGEHDAACPACGKEGIEEAIQLVASNDDSSAVP